MCVWISVHRKLRLFLEWGITFGKPYAVPERANRQVKYANREDLERNILAKHPLKQEQNDYSASDGAGSYGGMAAHAQSTVKSEKHRQVKT